MTVARLTDGIDPRFAAAAAIWAGFRVRRAMCGRELHGKLAERHELYLIILDAEEEAGVAQQRGPWVDVLYTGLARLRQEALEALRVALARRPSLSGGRGA